MKDILLKVRLVTENIRGFGLDIDNYEWCF